MNAMSLQEHALNQRNIPLRRNNAGKLIEQVVVPYKHGLFTIWTIPRFLKNIELGTEGQVVIVTEKETFGEVHHVKKP